MRKPCSTARAPHVERDQRLGSQRVAVGALLEHLRRAAEAALLGRRVARRRPPARRTRCSARRAPRGPRPTGAVAASSSGCSTIVPSRRGTWIDFWQCSQASASTSGSQRSGAPQLGQRKRTFCASTGAGDSAGSLTRTSLHRGHGCSSILARPRMKPYRGGRSGSPGLPGEQQPPRRGCNGRDRLVQARRRRADDRAPRRGQGARGLEAPRPDHPDEVAAHGHGRRAGRLPARRQGGRHAAGRAGTRSTARTSPSSRTSSTASPAGACSSPRSSSSPRARTPASASAARSATSRTPRAACRSRRWCTASSASAWSTPSSWSSAWSAPAAAAATRCPSG